MTERYDAPPSLLRPADVIKRFELPGYKLRNSDRYTHYLKTPGGTNLHFHDYIKGLGVFYSTVNDRYTPEIARTYSVTTAAKANVTGGELRFFGELRTAAAASRYAVNNEKVLTVTQLSGLLPLQRETFYEWISEGRMESYKIAGRTLVNPRWLLDACEIHRPEAMATLRSLPWVPVQ